MALPDPTIRTPLGFGRQPIKNFQEINKGERPNLPIMHPAKYLPVIREAARQQEWWVLLAGTIISLDANGYFVPANGGSAQTVTYTADDVDYTIDIDDAASFVAAAGAGATSIPANYPIGWVNEHMFSYTNVDRHVNYALQDFVSILCDYVVEFPLLWSEQTEGAQALAVGRLVAPLGVGATGQCGAPVLWRDGTDDVSQIAGRCQWLDTIAEVDNLSKVRTVRGIGLAGDGTSGIESWLVGTHEGGSAATLRARVAIGFL